MAPALGLRTVAVASSTEKAEQARRLGADHVVVSHAFLERTLDITAGRGVDVALDPVGGDRLADTLRATAEGGQVVVLGFAGGSIPVLDVDRLLRTNISVVGAGWGEYVRQNPSRAHRQWSDILSMIRNGRLSVRNPPCIRCSVRPTRSERSQTALKVANPYWHFDDHPLAGLGVTHSIRIPR